MAVTVFINYRRRDTQHLAGRLRDVVADRFGDDAVFIDVDSIAAATDYVTAIDQAVNRSDVMLVLIGEAWLDARDVHGRRRLDDPGDRVRLEIESALQRSVPVLPVVVDSASMPTSDDLPPPLMPLSRYHALRVRHDSFEDDSRRVVEVLERAR